MEVRSSQKRAYFPVSTPSGSFTHKTILEDWNLKEKQSSRVECKAADWKYIFLSIV